MFKSKINLRLMSLTHLWDKNRAHEEVRKELAYAWGNKIALGPKLKKERA